MGTRDGRLTLGGKRTAEELKMSHDGLRGGRQVQEKKSIKERIIHSKWIAKRCYKQV